MLQPKLEAFAQHVANGYAGESFAVRRCKAQEAEEAIDAIPIAVLFKTRQAANDMLGDGVWDAAVDAVASYCGNDHILAHLVLAKAYGWQIWIEMDQPVYLKPRPLPPVEQLRNSLRWLREGPLAMTEKELASRLLEGLI